MRGYRGERISWTLARLIGPARSRVGNILGCLLGSRKARGAEDEADDTRLERDDL